MNTSLIIKPNSDEAEDLRDQVELAQVTAWLSLVISAAVLLGRFGPQLPDLKTAQTAVEVHRKLLAEADASLKVNQEALGQNREALTRLRPVPNPASP